MIMAWTTLASQSEAFVDKCVLRGLVPPHPGDLERALGGQVENLGPAPPAIPRADRPQDPAPTEITPEEKQKIVESLRGIKNTLGQYAMTKLHDQIPRIATRDMRNIVRALIASGDVAHPVDENAE